MSKKEYSLDTVNKVYSYWGRSRLLYRLEVSFFGYFFFLRKKAINHLSLNKGFKVLDIGCGPGLTFKRIEKEIGSKGELIGVDYVNEMIKQCKKIVRRYKWSNVTLIQEDASKLSLKKNSLDAIIAITSLSAMPKPLEALNNCYNSLKKNGLMVILDCKKLSKHKWLNPLLKLVRWSKSYNENSDLLKIINEVFKNVKIEEYLLGSTFIAICRK
ncbi:MAG: class I SAM-dependent methyltransferase [Nanoarchaeota archaeon]|nr:class I SAM-dependent methyltransferase [Nanoarchaeota archaeon]